MYIDDGTTGDSGELKIDIDGHEYTEQENFSYAHDGTVDSVAVNTADGGHIVYSDTTHSGTADLVTEYDAQGDETAQAHFDAGSGHWVDDNGSTDPNAGNTGADGTDTTSTQAGDGGGQGETITVDTAGGPHSVGPATEDTNNDGRPDTAVVHDSNGNLILYTDAHGDGQATVATEISPDGQVVIAEHTGPHQWTVTERGHLGSDGKYHKDSDAAGSFTPTFAADGSGGQAVLDSADDQHWGEDGSASTARASVWAGAFSATGSAHGVVRIDANTGQWISQN